MDAQRTSFSSLFCRGHGEHFRHEHGYSFFDFVHPTFPQPNMVLPTIQSALKDDFGEAVVACDMPKPCKFLSLDIYQKRCLWAREDVDLTLPLVFSLVLQADVEKFHSMIINVFAIIYFLSVLSLMTHFVYCTCVDF